MSDASEDNNIITTRKNLTIVNQLINPKSANNK